MDKLRYAEYTYSNTPAFTLAGIKCWARMVACHDGDSPTVVFEYGGKMWRFLTRMYGLDTCEMTSKDPALKERAIKARDRLIQLAVADDSIVTPAFKNDKEIVAFLSKDVHMVWLECMDFDKYARPLVVLKHHPDDSKSFADLLIEEKLAYPYFGATKLSEQEQSHQLS